MQSKKHNTPKLSLVIASVLLMPFSFLWSGYVTTVMWKWFLVPLGVSNIGIAHAIGLSGLLFVLSPKYIPENELEFGGRIAFSFISPLYVLIIGWVVHSFM